MPPPPFLDPLCPAAKLLFGGATSRMPRPRKADEDGTDADPGRRPIEGAMVANAVDVPVAEQQAADARRAPTARAARGGEDGPRRCCRPPFLRAMLEQSLLPTRSNADVQAV